MAKSKGPVLIDLDGKKARKSTQTPDTAPPVPETLEAPTGKAMQTVAHLAARRPNRLARWFWRLAVVLMGFALSVWVWDFVNAMIARNTYLGYALITLTGLFLFVCLAIILREWAAFSRLKRLDKLRHQSEKARASGDLGQARIASDGLLRLYNGRDELQWGRQRLSERKDEMLDADSLLDLAEAELIAPLDQLARREIESAARQVATVTALVPLALADVFVAFATNLRMIRRIAEIYGGRSGTIGSWRLTRTVLTHLVATGAVSVGDDLIGSLAGGGVLSKVSRRFGEGVINGALTARVGIAAMDVCRPVPFVQAKRPTVTSLIQRALTGLFSSRKAE